MSRTSGMCSLFLASIVVTSAMIPLRASADIVHFALSNGNDNDNISFNIQTAAGTTVGTTNSHAAHSTTFNSLVSINGVDSTTDDFISFYDTFYGGGLVLRDSMTALFLETFARPWRSAAFAKTASVQVEL